MSDIYLSPCRQIPGVQRTAKIDELWDNKNNAKDTDAV
jgi:hypothetical protein